MQQEASHAHYANAFAKTLNIPCWRRKLVPEMKMRKLIPQGCILLPDSMGVAHRGARETGQDASKTVFQAIWYSLAFHLIVRAVDSPLAN